jgi:Domain of unknown function (DUF4123)
MTTLRHASGQTLAPSTASASASGAPAATSPAQLKALLWPDAAARVHAVIDGTRVPGLPARLAAEDVVGWDCLERGALAPAVAERAPYIAELNRGAAFTDWLLFEASAALAGWGVVASSRRALLDIREHFRALMEVRLPDGTTREWRWYAPDVLDTFIALAGAEQQAALLGPLRLLAAPRPSQWNCHAFDGAAVITTARRLQRAPS